MSQINFQHRNILAITCVRSGQVVNIVRLRAGPWLVVIACAVVRKVVTLVVATVVGVTPTTATAATAVVMVPVGVHVRAVGALSVVVVVIPLKMSAEGRFAFPASHMLAVFATVIQYIR